MIRVKLIAVAVLGIFAANAVVCPCPSLEGRTDPAANSAGAAHHAETHGMHGEHASAHETQPANPDCHPDSAAGDCGMASSLDADARPAPGNPTGTDQPTALTIGTIADIGAARLLVPLRLVDRPPDPRAVSTPISKHERLLI